MNKIKEWFIIKYASIIQLIAWLPIIWNDRDWDSHYLYKVMKFKIDRMIKEFEKCNRHYSHDNDIKQMKMAKELLNKLIKNEYSIDEYKNKIKCKCPSPDYKFEPINQVEDCSEFISLKCSYCLANLKSWFLKMGQKEKSDRAYLFKLLDKNSKKWWC